MSGISKPGGNSQPVNSTWKTSFFLRTWPWLGIPTMRQDCKDSDHFSLSFILPFVWRLEPTAAPVWLRTLHKKNQHSKLKGSATNHQAKPASKAETVLVLTESMPKTKTEVTIMKKLRRIMITSHLRCFVVEARHCQALPKTLAGHDSW